MKNTVSKATWGILFVLLGLVLAGRAFNLFYFNIFFSGWWTLFIIIPCAIGLSDRGNRTTSIIGLGIGILLLLSAQGIFQWYMFGKILIAFLFVVIGCSLILKGNHGRDYFDYHDRDNNSSSYHNEYNRSESANSQSANYGSNNEGTNNDGTNNDGNNSYGSNSYGNNSYGNNNYGSNNYSNNNYSSNNHGSTNHSGYSHFSGVLSGRNIQFVDEVFTGAVVNSILGNVQLDLRNAIFNGNAVVETTCILGGVDIYVPSNVKVMVNCTPILAGVDNNVINSSNSSGEMHTLFITGTCILGGIDVK